LFRLFTPLFSEFDRIIATFTGAASSRVMVAVTPVLAASLTLWFTYWAVQVMRGSVKEPVIDLLSRIVRTSLILSFALSAGYYQATVAELVRTVPDDLAAAILGDDASVYPLSAAPEPGVSGAGTLIDVAAGKGINAAMDALHKGTLLSEQGIVFCVLGLLILLATVAMVSVGGASILVAKVVLGVLVAVGPLFVAALLFDSTRKFFDRWVAMLVTYGLVLVLFAVFFSFMLGIFQHYMTQVQFDGVMNVGYGIAGALIITVVTILALREAKVLAIGLSGGVALPRLSYGHLFRGSGQRQARSAPPPSPSRKGEP
jgi:type IV secretion system protein VirB6